MPEQAAPVVPERERTHFYGDGCPGHQLQEVGVAIKRREHCRNLEQHAGHAGVERWWDGQRLGVYCDGTPEFLARELEREANPPPGPPDPPRPKIDWTADV